MMRAFAALAALAACSGAPRQVGSEPSWRHAAAPVRAAPVTVAAASVAPSPGAPMPVFVPLDPPALRYEEPAQPPPSSPLGDAVLAAVRSAATAANQPAPIADARLFSACAELAEVVPEQGVIRDDLIEFAIQRNGIAEPTAQLVVAWGPIDQPRTVVDQLAPQLPDMLTNAGTIHVGVGAARRNPDGTGAVVIALQPVKLTMLPVPRVLPADGTAAIAATLDPSFHDPEVLVTYDDGSTGQLVLAPGQPGHVAAQLSCVGHHGREEVEISASNTWGANDLVNFPVWCGAEPPAIYAIESAPDEAPVAPDVAAKQIFDLVNRARRHAHVPPLVWDDRLAAIARAHSEDMRTTGIVAHVSPTTGSYADRAKAAGIRTTVLLENVASAYSVTETHEGLMNSPGHRANILAADVTNIGIGVALGDPTPDVRPLYVTEMFTRVPPKIDPPRVAELVREKLVAVQPMQVDPQLGKIAQQYAAGLATGQDHTALWSAVQRELVPLGERYARVSSVTDTIADLGTLDAKALLGAHHPSGVGVGIAQGPHPTVGENAIWIVLLLGEPRT